MLPSTGKHTEWRALVIHKAEMMTATKQNVLFVFKKKITTKAIFVLFFCR